MSNPQALRDMGQALPSGANSALWNVMVGELPDEPIGLEISTAVPMTVVGPLIHAAEHAQTRREAMEVLATYVGNSTFITYTTTETDTEIRITIDHPDFAIDKGAFIEFLTANLFRFNRDSLGINPDEFIAVEFRSSQLAPNHHYDNFFDGVELRFEQPTSSLVLQPGSLDKPTIQPDAELFTYLEAYLKTGTARRSVDDLDHEEMIVLQRAVAGAVAIGSYSVEEIASNLGISVRSLQRRCEGLGVTPGQLIDRVRSVHARQLLADREVSIKEAAKLLGYSSPRAFRRAVRRWTGCSPRELRSRGHQPALTRTPVR